MPCRVGEIAPLAGSVQASRFIHGMAPNDSFDVRVPWDWGQHPGVVNEDGEYRAKHYEALLKAWQAQLEQEQAEDEAAAATTADDGPTAVTETTQQPHGERLATAENRQATEDNLSPDAPAKDSPIAKQRVQIADFMKRHEQFAANHPFATSCGYCRHKLDKSPTKDESVPHCAWASRLRRVYFKTLEPGDKQSPRVPVCRQFVPIRPWNELIPAHSNPPGVPRDWLKQQILHLVKAANQRSNDRNAFEFLTGRPMGANENYSDWFSQQLAAQGGDLSDAQLFTLFVWAHVEWQRAGRNAFSLPVNGQGVQFAVYQEHGWGVSKS